MFCFKHTFHSLSLKDFLSHLTWYHTVTDTPPPSLARGSYYVTVMRIGWNTYIFYIDPDITWCSNLFSVGEICLSKADLAGKSRIFRKLFDWRDCLQIIWLEGSVELLQDLCILVLDLLFLLPEVYSCSDLRPMKEYYIRSWRILAFVVTFLQSCDYKLHPCDLCYGWNHCHCLALGSCVKAWN